MALGISSTAQSLWSEALERADRIQSTISELGTVTADDWIDFDDELTFLIEEEEEDMTALELRLATLLQENVAPVLIAAKANQPLPEAELFNWNWAAHLALAINGDLISRRLLWQWTQEEPEKLDEWLEKIGIVKAELPARIFERPEEIVEMETVTAMGADSERLKELERLATIQEGEY